MTPRLNYWIEAVELALEDIGKQGLLSKEEIKDMAETLQGSSEQEDMAFGIEQIPNPLISEIRDLKSKHEKEIAEADRRDLIFRKNVADRHGPYVGVEDVYIDGNDVVYDHKGLY